MLSSCSESGTELTTYILNHPFSLLTWWPRLFYLRRLIKSLKLDIGTSSLTITGVYAPNIESRIESCYLYFANIPWVCPLPSTYGRDHRLHLDARGASQPASLCINLGLCSTLQTVVVLRANQILRLWVAPVLGVKSNFHGPWTSTALH